MLFLAVTMGLSGVRYKEGLLFATYLIGSFGSALSTIYAYNASNARLVGTQRY